MFGFDSMADAAARVHAQQQQNAFNSIFGGLGYASQSQERAMTDEDKRRMAIRRCGNICLDARAAGWRVAFEGGPRQYWAAFVSKDGQRYVTGKPYTTKELALISATEQLATYGFLRD